MPLTQSTCDLAALLHSGRTALAAVEQEKQAAELLRVTREHEAAELHWLRLGKAVEAAIPECLWQYASTSYLTGYPRVEDGAEKTFTSRTNEWVVDVTAPGCISVECRFVFTPESGWIQTNFPARGWHRNGMPWRISPYEIKGCHDEPPYFTVGKEHDEYVFADSLPVALALAEAEYARRNALLGECERKNAAHAEQVAKYKAQAAEEAALEAKQGVTRYGCLLSALEAFVVEKVRAEVSDLRE